MNNLATSVPNSPRQSNLLSDKGFPRLGWVEANGRVGF